MVSITRRFVQLGLAAALCLLAVAGSPAQDEKKPAPPAAAGVEAAPPAQEDAAAAEPQADTAEPAEPAPSAPPPPPPSDQVRRNEAGEPLVTNVFFDSDLRQALADIATQAGVVIVPDMTVAGYVTADLQDVPLEKALDIVLAVGGLVWRQLDGYYLVGAADPQNPNFPLLCDTEVIALRYVDVDALLEFRAGPYKPYITVIRKREEPSARQRAGGERPQLRAMGRNRLIVTAPPSIMKRIKDDLARIDVPPRQIMLEATVIEVSEDALRELGIDWTLRHFQFASQLMGMGEGGGGAAGQLEAGSLSYTKLANTETALLKALVENGQARLRANPRVTTADGETATIEVGQESYFAIITGPVTFPYTTLEQIPSGITLSITPRFIEDTGEIVADVFTDVRDVTGRGSNDLPEITFRRALTRVRVKDGEGIVIGGLTTESEYRTRRKVPFLGDLPLLGQLFRRSVTRRKTSEVIIVITPHLLDESGRYPGAPEPPAAVKPK